MKETQRWSEIANSYPAPTERYYVNITAAAGSGLEVKPLALKAVRSHQAKKQRCPCYASPDLPEPVGAGRKRARI